MRAEDFIKEHQGGVLLKDYTLKDVEYFMEQYANQRVIEELNSVAIFCQGATEEMIYEAVTKRINQLTQD